MLTRNIRFVALIIIVPLLCSCDTLPEEGLDPPLGPNPGTTSSIEIEPNGTSITATFIGVGRIISGNFLSRNDIDLFRIDLTQQRELTVTLSTTERHDIHFESSNMTIMVSVISGSNLIGGFTSNRASAVFTKILAGPGTIFVQVQTSRATAGGVRTDPFNGSLRYSLTVS